MAVKRNQHPGACSRCRNRVEAGAGLVETIRDADTLSVTHRLYHSPCYPRAEPAAGARRPPPASIEELAARTAAGRVWLAYWLVRGMRTIPAGVTHDDLDELLEGCDLSRMDAAVEEQRESVLRSPRIHDPLEIAL